MTKVGYLLLIISMLAMPFASIADKNKKEGSKALIHKEVQGEHCVRDGNYMARNHFKHIIDRRTETVRKGMRLPTDKPKAFDKDGKPLTNYSLELCVNCHARDAKGQPVALKTKEGKANTKHFCNSCHTYVGVSINCFQCHRGTPRKGVKVELITKKPK
jgi:hypothetical protein